MLALLFEIVLVLMVVFVVYYFFYVRREANHRNVDCIWIEETMSCISTVLIFDLLSDFCQ